MKRQKGFIQIPLLIIVIASIVVASVGTGMILHKQKKLVPLIANISQVFRGTEETTLLEETKVHPEKPQSTEEAITQSKTSQQEISQQSQELEKVEAETEKLKKEAEAKRLAELQKQKEEARKITEEKAKAKAEQERLQQQLEAQRKAEEEARIKAEQERQQQLEEAQRKAEETRIQAERESFEEIKNDLIYYSQDITSLGRDFNQTVGRYDGDVQYYLTNYQNQIDSYESIYKPQIERLHGEILNEASKGLWTNCSWLREFLEYRNSYYDQYSTSLNNAERSLKSNINQTARWYMSDWNWYLDKIEQYENALTQLRNKLANLSVSDKSSTESEITSLFSKLNLLKSEVDEFIKGKVYTYYPPSSKLSKVESLMWEEENLLLNTSCQNLPTRLIKKY